MHLIIFKKNIKKTMNNLENKIIKIMIMSYMLIKKTIFRKRIKIQFWFSVYKYKKNINHKKGIL